ncbi:hypothetical protein RRG08_055814 [Elysia crispata]|uniref:Uncharacterized protein n=1 Tax=Elysia crispata TaxID=231223 RepID=A0AAE1AXT9_9GAST|nr:hypothetical protein RRG08_055814 [Elysia crispata]
MTDIQESQAGRFIVKRCVNEATCYNDWFILSSDQNDCLNFDPRLPADNLDCHFCCVSDNCNTGTKPADSSLYNP